MRLLVFAPHPDDELLGCAGLMTRVLKHGGSVRVVLVTNGDVGGDPVVRAAEFAAGLARIGHVVSDLWGYPDTALPLDEMIGEQYRQLVLHWQPTDIAIPSPSESHADHRRLTRGVLDHLTGHWSGTLWFYETINPLPQVNHTEPINLDSKLLALACHVSQQRQFDFQGLTRGLALLRGCQIGQPAGEAFLRFEWDGSVQNFFEHRPLVSIIVRADQQNLLRVALASLCAQSYDHIEVIVVWHGKQPCGQMPPDLKTKIVAGPGSRSANLNAGLAVASGAFVAFLDQDDVWSSEFLAVLLPELQCDARLDIVYGDYRQVTCTLGPAGVEVLHTGEARGVDYRRSRLLVGNYIPLNTFLCRTGLAARLQFDETLEAYEDWDFLARAELQQLTFKFIPEIISEYRIFPLTGESANIAQLHARKGYLPWRTVVLNKIAKTIDASQWIELVDLTATIESERNQAQSENKKLQQELAQRHQQLAELQETAKKLQDWADLLTPERVGQFPLSRMAGRAMFDGPCFAVILPVCDPEPIFLIEAIHSVLYQSYSNWQLCIADDNSIRADVLTLINKLTEDSLNDPRLRVVKRTRRGGIVAASQSALRLAQAPWVAFLDHDDRLHPDALLELAACLRKQPDLECIFTDSRTIDRNGTVLHSFNKPDWAPETLLHLNYINHLSVVRHDVFEQVGGLRQGFDGSQDWDLWLRLAHRPNLRVEHLAQPLYDWRATETSVAYTVSAKPYVIDAACRCTSEYLRAKGLSNVSAQAPTGRAGLRYSWDSPVDPLSVIVPTHRNPVGLARLLNSLNNSDYPGLQVILIANNVASDDRMTHALLDQTRNHQDWKVIQDDRPFNWARLNNSAVKWSATPCLLFLNDDVEIVGADSLRSMVRYLHLDQQIGAVGARLIYDAEQGGGVQHDGVATDPGWIARNMNSDIDGTGLGMPRNVSAVTGAALLTRRDLFDLVGGFDERLPMSYNDVDYCLQLRCNGFRIVQASDVEWIHSESRTRGPLDSQEKHQQLMQEGQFMRDKWRDFLIDHYRLIYSGRFTASRIVHIPDA